jgi:hypothetical protein
MHPKGRYSLDEFIQGDHDYYTAFVSPRLVRDIAGAFANVTAKGFKQWERESGGDRHSAVDWLFPELKAAYLEAAAENMGLMIVIA